VPSCFVIQKFDEGGTYDTLYDEVFEPAIRAADLAPDRVDRDPSVQVPITRIEEGMRKARVCFAEISTDSPNVWFELGYAISMGKPVVIVCSGQRVSFPFDVQHRHVVKYRTSVPSDFRALGAQITQRLRAAMQKGLEPEHPMRGSPDLAAHDTEATAPIAEDLSRPNRTASAALWYCGNADCPTCLPYGLGPDEVAFCPVMVESAKPVNCSVCGLEMAATCPRCERPVFAKGAFCQWQHCGAALVYAHNLEFGRGQAYAWSEPERQRRMDILRTAGIG